MYRVTTAIHIHFSHHIRGHSGPCISLHGHTWKYELSLQADTLDAGGFVVDFDVVDQQVLAPCHLLLDHSLALGEQSYLENRQHLEALGQNLLATRGEMLGSLGVPPPVYAGELAGARNERPGGIKVAVFPFGPTSERLARWFYEVAIARLSDDRVSVASARVYETLHPVECVAEYVPSDGV
jgi:6-pyruvoyl-tetrahydropterin synthase